MNSASGVEMRVREDQVEDLAWELIHPGVVETCRLVA